ncbi:MAG TPA: hypothetical protein VLI92_04430 [Candidatus Saccharimonadales bacterium]|nr:hypothetical protein [Candidatus Saccharimonadales bacterium]
MTYPEIYYEMSDRNRQIIREKGVKYDETLKNTAPDKRVGLAILALYESFEDENLTKLTNEVKTAFPSQIVYTQKPKGPLEASIHFTFMQIFGVLSEEAGISKINLDQYKPIISDSFKDLEPFEVVFKHVIAVPTGLVIAGYPSIDINIYRDNLRNLIKKSGLPFSEPYYTVAVHSNLLRLCCDESADKILAFANKYKEIELGKLQVSKFIFGFGTWKVLPNEINMPYTISL